MSRILVVVIVFLSILWTGTLLHDQGSTFLNIAVNSNQHYLPESDSTSLSRGLPCPLFQHVHSPWADTCSKAKQVQLNHSIFPLFQLAIFSCVLSLGQPLEEQFAARTPSSDINLVSPLTKIYIKHRALLI